MAIGAPVEASRSSAAEELAAAALQSVPADSDLTEEKDPVLRRLKQPSRQTREWLAFTEKHQLEDVLDDPGFWGNAILGAAEKLPFDTPGQRIAACLSAAARLAVAEDVQRGPFLRLAKGFFKALTAAGKSEAA
jgi:hypothetical protein